VSNLTADPDAWRDWPIARLEREYSPSTCVPSIDPFLAGYTRGSAEALATLSSRRNLPWGHGTDEVFDFFPAASPNSPLLVFFHGGYWQEHSKDDVLFVASKCVPRGIAYASVNYTLAPRTTVSTIVDQCRRAVISISRQASELGFDPRRLFVAGSSAGAHLASMLLIDGWQRHEPSSENVIAGAILLSGIYDLQPLVPTYINQALKMTPNDAIALSPVKLRLAPPAPVVVAWGENEPDEFKRQSQVFANVLRESAFPVKTLEARGANHFDIVFEIADPETALGRLTLDLIAGEETKR
jgi:arylformamidase